MKGSSYCAAGSGKRAALPAFVLAALIAVLLACASAPVSAFAAEGDGAAGDLAAASLDANAKAVQKASSVKAQSFDDSSAPYPVECTPLRLGVTSQVNLNSDNDDVQWFSFLPGQSGFYRFESSDSDDDPYGALYAPSDGTEGLKRIAHNDDGGSEDLCFRVVAWLDSGTTYYLACSELDDVSDVAYKLTVTAYDEHDFANVIASSKTRFWSGKAVKFEDLDATLRMREYYYDEGEEEWDYSSHNLEEGSDYQFAGWYSENGIALNGEPSAVGNYYARIVATGSYTGECKLNFSIVDSYDLENGMWYLQSKSLYSDTAINERTLELAVVPRDEEGKPPVSVMPTLGKQFKVKAWYRGVAGDADDMVYQKIASTPKEPGRYKVEVEGISPFKGTLQAYFSIYDPKSLDDYVIDSYSSLSLGTTPSLSNLGVVVYRYNSANVLLKPGVDYALVRWEKRVYDEEQDAYKRVPTTTFTETDVNYYGVLAGKGAYKGEVSFSFQMFDPYDLENYAIERARYIAYDGKPITLAKLNLKVVYEDEQGRSKTLAYGTDYTIKYSRLEDIYDDQGKWIDDRLVELDPSEVVNPDWYYVTIVGKGKYHGEQSASFRIVDSKSLEYATVSGVKGPYYLANGKTLTLKPTVTALDGTKLTEGTHYTVTWMRYDDKTGESKPTSPVISQIGEYCITFEAKDNSGYEGELDYEFTVRSDSERKPLANEYFIDGIPASYTYTGKPFMPTPTVRALGWYYETLTPNVDYYVTYRNNVNAGTATVTVMGKGAYSGTLTKNFTINKANNPMVAKPIKKSVKISSLKLKKKAVQVKNIRVLNAKGKVTFKNASTNKIAKKFKINNKGVLVIPKKCPRGSYAVKIKVADNGGTNYKPVTKGVAFTVKVIR